MQGEIISWPFLVFKTSLILQQLPWKEPLSCFKSSKHTLCHMGLEFAYVRKDCSIAWRGASYFAEVQGQAQALHFWTEVLSVVEH